MALDKNRLREAARRVGEGEDKSTEKTSADMNALRDAAQRSTTSSGTGDGSGAAGVVWLIIIGVVIWYFFIREKPSAPAPAPVAAAAPAAAPPAPAPAAPVPDPAAVREREVATLARAVIDANKAGIDAVLELAESTADSTVITAAARQAGRAYKFDDIAIVRNRNEARLLNGQALEALNERQDAVEACKLATKALIADPLDAEVAGNLAICLFRQGQHDDARAATIYALSLPRSDDSPGRAADWTTMAANFADNSEPVNARRAMFVTLALSADMTRYCQSTLKAIKTIYGPALKGPAEAAFERIRDSGLPAASECALPIE